MSEPYANVPCPMPDCDQALHLVWEVSRQFYAGDLADAVGLPVTDAHARQWRVECQEGHAVLLPGPGWCDCDDPRGEGCTHAADEYDWSDERRNFTRTDMARLRGLLARMTEVRADV